MKPTLLLAGLLFGGGLALAGPLDPLSAAEITRATNVLRLYGKASASTRYALIALQEPDKTSVYQGKTLNRQARLVLYERETHQTFEAIVDLQNKTIVRFQEVAGVQPGFMTDDFVIAQQLVSRDPRWQEAMRKRGISTGQVSLDTAGGRPEPGEEGRILVVTTYLRGASWNPYARPIEGVVARVDVAGRRVLSFSDTGSMPVSQNTGAATLKTSTLKPLTVRQPQGASFVVKGHEVSWDRWKFSYSLDGREGLVIHQAGWQEGKTVRPVLYRGSVSEMVVPYGDPDPNHTWRQPFDAGEYGLGLTASPLVKGGDVPEHALLRDEVLFSQGGVPSTYARAVAIYERDAGLLMRHMDPYTRKTVSVRGRELCISMVSTVGNYDYMFTWVFSQTGALRAEVALTGIMASKGASGGDGHSSHQVDPRVQALHHQHLFNFRLDLDVDGTLNRLSELNTTPMEVSEENPVGNAMHLMKTPVRSEQEGMLDASAATARNWLVQSGKANSLGEPTGYVLVPGKSTPLIASEDAPIWQRASFLRHDLWVTRYRKEELYASGDYPTNHPMPGGVSEYVQDDEPLDKQDLVLWYTLGVTHIPRPEEWPIMNVHVVGFSLEPAGFFDRNPILK